MSTMPTGWWLHSSRKPMFVAFDERSIGAESNVPILAYTSKGNYNWFAPDSFLHTLPADAGFDWKPEPEYPEYWTPHNSRYAYLRRDSDTTHVCVELDGTESNPCDWSAILHDGRTRITKAEAEARVVRRKSIPEQCPDRWFIWSDDRYPIAFVKHASGQVFNLNVDSILKQSDDWHGGYEDQLTNGELVEVTEFSAKAFLKRPRSASQIQKSAEPDPKQWVTQDRVPARIGIDQESWIRTMDPIHWRDLAPIGPAAVGKMMHGQKDSFGDTLLLRCRRRDLPPLTESKPNRIPVRLYWYDGNVVARFAHSPPTDPSFIEIKLDPQMIISGSGFYVEGRIA